MNKTTLKPTFPEIANRLFLKTIVWSMMLFSLSSFSQELIETREIIDRDELLNNMSTFTDRGNSQHLKSLIDDLKPAVYFENGTVNAYGENPTALFTNPDSIATISNAAINTENIEIATIRLSRNTDVTRSLDLSVFSAYPRLKYIYILSSVQNNPQQIIRSVKNIPAGLRVFYKIDLGS